MKKQTLAVIGIIAIGSLFSIVYATGTVISDSGIITPSLTVNGNQIGESSFTSYNTVVLNTTAATSGTENDVYTNAVISNSGNSIFSGNEQNVFVKLDGTTKFLNGSGILPGSQQFSQSMTGEYAVIKNNGVTPPTISVIKNGIYLQALGINFGQLTATNNINGIVSAISPDGHYILVVASDSGTGNSRVLVFRGS